MIYVRIEGTQKEHERQNKKKSGKIKNILLNRWGTKDRNQWVLKME